MSGAGEDAAKGVVAAQTNTIQSAHVASSGATLVEFASPDETVAAVRNGEADAVLADKAFLIPIVEQSGGDLVFLGGDVILGDGIGVGLRESDGELKAKLDAAIAELKADGSLNEMIKKWFGGRPRKSGEPARGRRDAPPLIRYVRVLRRSLHAQRFSWLACYLTTGKHLAFYFSFLWCWRCWRWRRRPLWRWAWRGAGETIRPGAAALGGERLYVHSARRAGHHLLSFRADCARSGVEWTRHKIICSDVTEPIRRGNDFVVCAEAKLPLSSAEPWMHDVYGFTLALIAYAIVFGAFAANVLDGALKAVPKGQLEAAQAIGMSPTQALRRVHLPQMWIYALPGCRISGRS